MNTISVEKGSTRMIAHRGLSGIEPENTLAAFIAAGNRSYFGIETDVHVTRDGKYICTHDDTTGRVAMQNLTVENTDYEELRNICLNETDGTVGRRLFMPSLEEYIRICRKYEKTAVLELKNRIETHHIKNIVEIIRKEGYLEHTLFISFYPDNLVDLRAMEPEQPIQFLIERKHPELLSFLEKYHFGLDSDYTLLSPELIDAVHKLGHTVNCWTVNTKADAERLISWGVDFITSNILE